MVSALIRRRPREKRPLKPILVTVIVLHVLAFAFAPEYLVKPEASTPPDTTVVVITPAPRVEVDEVRVTDEPKTDDPLPFKPPIESPMLPPPPPRPPVAGPVAPGPVAPAVQRPFVPYDRAPVMIRSVMPEYPRLARSAGIEGTVVLVVLISDAGKPVSVEVLSNDGTESMAKSAIAAAWECRFEPARQGHKAVKARVTIPFEFRLD